MRERDAGRLSLTHKAQPDIRLADNQHQKGETNQRPSSTALLSLSVRLSLCVCVCASSDPFTAIYVALPTADSPRQSLCVYSRAPSVPLFLSLSLFHSQLLSSSPFQFIFPLSCARSLSFSPSLSFSLARERERRERVSATVMTAGGGPPARSRCIKFTFNKT